MSQFPLDRVGCATNGNQLDYIVKINSLIYNCHIAYIIHNHYNRELGLLTSSKYFLVCSFVSDSM